MLEITFKRILEQIQAVATSHLRDNSDAALEAKDWEFIFSDFDDWCVLHLSTMDRGGYWVFPTLVPEARVPELKERLPDFDITPSSVAYSHVMQGDNHWLEPYWGEAAAFDDAEVQLYFNRSHYGRPKGAEHYVEFNQLVTHPLELHWSPDKSAYCRVDDQGEEAEKIKLIETDQLTLFLIRRRTLDKLLHLGKWALVRYVSFQRWRSEHPPFSSAVVGTYEAAHYEGKFRVRKCGAPGLEYVEFRGAQIERPLTPKSEVLSWRADDDDGGAKKFANFIVYDWKNGRVLDDYSLSPSNFSNYFTENDLPFEMSPIYFNAEVLDKYKSNPDKFTLRDRSIDCRGGWWLDTFDVNEHRQVHTYAVYLARLPFKEQLHWAQYNEAQKGPLSERAFQTDFEGRFPTSPPPKLFQLEEALHDLGQIRVGPQNSAIWSPKGGSWESASRGLFPLNTENSSQWHDFIIALANSTNEGFDVQALRHQVTAIGGSTNGPDGKPLQSLGLLKAIVAQVSPSDLAATWGVLSDLQNRRGMGKAHGSWKTPEGSLVDDANKRLTDVIEAILKLTTIMRGLEIPPPTPTAASPVKGQ